MVAIVLTMLAIVVLAGLVLAYVAFPHRGEDLPAAPWLSDVMTKATDATPTIADGEMEPASEPAPAHRR